MRVAMEPVSSFEFYDNEQITIARLHYHVTLYLQLPYNYGTQLLADLDSVDSS